MRECEAVGEKKFGGESLVNDSEHKPELNVHLKKKCNGLMSVWSVRTWIYSQLVEPEER